MPIIFSSLSVPLHSFICVQISPVQQGLPSTPQSPLSLSTRHLLTSTLLELDKPSMPSPPQSPIPEDTTNYGNCHDFSKVSSVSWVSQSQSSSKSSVLSSRVKDSHTAALAVPHKTEVGLHHTLSFMRN